MGLVFLGLGVQALRTGLASRRWTRVSGKVRKLAIETTTTPNRAAANQYVARLDYEYEFGPRLYRKDALVTASYTSRAMAVEEARKYREGEAVDVYVNASLPDQSILTPGVNAGALLPLIAGGLCFAFGAWQLST